MSWPSHSIVTYLTLNSWLWLWYHPCHKMHLLAELFPLCLQKIHTPCLIEFWWSERLFDLKTMEPECNTSCSALCCWTFQDSPLCMKLIFTATHIWGEGVTDFVYGVFSFNTWLHGTEELSGRQLQDWSSCSPRPREVWAIRLMITLYAISDNDQQKLAKYSHYLSTPRPLEGWCWVLGVEVNLHRSIMITSAPF